MAKVYRNEAGQKPARLVSKSWATSKTIKASSTQWRTADTVRKVRVRKSISIQAGV